MTHMLASRITAQSGESSYGLEDKMEDVDSQDYVLKTICGVFSV